MKVTMSGRTKTQNSGLAVKLPCSYFIMLPPKVTMAREASREIIIRYDYKVVAIGPD